VQTARRDSLQDRMEAYSRGVGMQTTLIHA